MTNIHTFSSYTLMDFARAASQSGAQITITNANSLSSYTEVDIAKTAPGRVTFKN